MMLSYEPQVIADSSGNFCGNALRFPLTAEGKKAAEVYVADLAMRWTLVSETRVIESPDEPNRDEQGEHIKA